jgi:hypothetical protein
MVAFSTISMHPAGSARRIFCPIRVSRARIGMRRAYLLKKEKRTGYTSITKECISLFAHSRTTVTQAFH